MKERFHKFKENKEVDKGVVEKRKGKREFIHIIIEKN